MDVTHDAPVRAPMERVRAAVQALVAARAELVAALRDADRAGIARNELARLAGPVMSRPTVLRLLGPLVGRPAKRVLRAATTREAAHG